MGTDKIHIPGYPGYGINSEGVVFKDSHGKVSQRNGRMYYAWVKERVVKPYLEDSGYLRLNLKRGGKQVKELHHRIVALVFIDNPHNLPVVNHKDGNKRNNAIDNLEWVTPSENIKHGYDTGLIIRRGGAGTPSKLNMVQIAEIKDLLNTGITHKQISNLYNVVESTISKINCGRTWKHVSQVF